MFKGTDAYDLATKHIKPPVDLLGSWLKKPCIGMIYGKAGTGKSFFALAIATCLAGGGKLLKWESHYGWKVAYIDCELGLGSIQRRQKSVVLGQGYDFEKGSLKYLTFEDTDGIIPNLANKAMQDRYSYFIRDCDVVIFDHISGICRPEKGNEDEVAVWAKVQAWAIKERGNGRALIFLHHSSKSGGQRGSSTKEDCLDFIMALRRPPGYQQRDGCKFELHFEKCRDFEGDAADPLYCELTSDADGRLSWKSKPLAEERNSKVWRLADQGLRSRDIADLLMMQASEVNFILTQRKSTIEGGSYGHISEDDNF